METRINRFLRISRKNESTKKFFSSYFSDRCVSKLSIDVGVYRGGNYAFFIKFIFVKIVTKNLSQKNSFMYRGGGGGRFCTYIYVRKYQRVN